MTICVTCTLRTGTQSGVSFFSGLRRRGSWIFRKDLMVCMGYGVVKKVNQQHSFCMQQREGSYILLYGFFFFFKGGLLILIIVCIIRHGRDIVYQAPFHVNGGELCYNSLRSYDVNLWNLQKLATFSLFLLKLVQHQFTFFKLQGQACQKIYLRACNQQRTNFCRFLLNRTQRKT